MAQRSHVPKFGNWERENVPYTTYFENARREKGAGAKMINPNDPEQNPDAFTYGTLTRESETRPKHRMENSDDFEIHRAVRAPQLSIASDRETHVVKQPQRKHRDMEGGGFNERMDTSTSAHHSSHHRVVDSQSRNHKSSNSGSGSDKSSSDFSLIKSHNHGSSSIQSKSSAEASNSFTPSQQRQTTLKCGNTQRNEAPRKIASVPKFGSWDETDPRSGEGFTVIFNKVKEEKHIGAGKFPTVPVEPPADRISHRNHENSGLKSKICCCFFWRASE